MYTVLYLQTKTRLHYTTARTWAWGCLGKRCHSSSVMKGMKGCSRRRPASSAIHRASRVPRLVAACGKVGRMGAWVSCLVAAYAGGERLGTQALKGEWRTVALHDYWVKRAQGVCLVSKGGRCVTALGVGGL